MASPQALVHALAALALACLTSLSVPASTARACSGLPCPRGEVFPSGGNVPANVIAIQWSKPRSGRDLVLAPDSAGTLKRAEGDQLIVVPFTNTNAGPTSSVANLVPTEAIPPGTELEFSYSWTCRDESELLGSHLTVTAAAPLPSSLGSLAYTLQRGTVSRAGGSSCVATTDAVYADLTVTLASDAVPFQDVIRYGLEVDGQEISPFVPGDPREPHAEPARLGGSPLGRGKDRIYTACGGPALAGVDPGTHRVRMTGLLPDGTQLASDDVELTLRCDASSEGGTSAATASDGGTSLGADGLRAPVGDASRDGGERAGDDSDSARILDRYAGCSLGQGQGGRGAGRGVAAGLLLVIALYSLLARPSARFDSWLARPRARFDSWLARPRARFDLRRRRASRAR